MSTGRMEALSDGVIAILITVMVLELPTPHAPPGGRCTTPLPVLLTYVLSFVYLGIYWIQPPPHASRTTSRVNGLILWANMHCDRLSLIPVTTAWMGKNHFAAVPARLRTASCCSPAAVAYYALQTTIISDHGPAHCSPGDRPGRQGKARRS